MINQGKTKSRSFRRIKVRVPSGKSVMHYKKKQPSKAKCTHCGAILKGVARVRATKLKNIALTKKRPSRPYGGMLCTRCMRAEIIKNITE
jgi:large subunit ribosomal protein L34e